MNIQIYGTFGPACRTKEILKEMVLAGMTGMRLNLSHTTLPNSESYIKAYQEVASECDVKPQILIDMQGPELRVGELKQPVFLEEGEIVLFYAINKENSFLLNQVPDNNEEFQDSIESDSHQKIERDFIDTKNRDSQQFENISENNENIHQKNLNIEIIYKQELKNIIELPIPAIVVDSVCENDEILLDDGKIQVKVSETASAYVKGKVLRGGYLKGHKSIKVLNKNMQMPVLTSHDIENIKLAKAYGVTALMQPFVLSGNDLRYVRSVLKEYDAEDIAIFAKIENQLGVQNLEDILQEADVIIIARGDLGNDMPLWELPKVQKQIEETCKKHQKPYIVVTQMLASMEEHSVPTRAEVSDIFHAVFHGAYGVMITGESAIGKYPIEAIKYLANTAKIAEKYKYEK